MQETEWAWPSEMLHHDFRDKDKGIQGLGGMWFPVAARPLRGEMVFDGWETWTDWEVEDMVA